MSKQKTVKSMVDIFEMWKLDTDNRSYETEYPYMIWDCNSDEPVGWYYDRETAESVFNALTKGASMKEIIELTRRR